MKRATLAMTVGLLALCGKAWPASFDCSSPKTVSETIICTDPDISKEEEKFTIIYKKAKEIVKDSDRAEFNKSNKEAWIWREKNCKEKVCLSEWFINRQVYLLERIYLAGGETPDFNDHPTRVPNNSMTTQAPSSLPYINIPFYKEIEICGHLGSPENQNPKYHYCIKEEQSSYDYLKMTWEDISYRVKEECKNISESQRRHIFGYSFFVSCIRARAEREDILREREELNKQIQFRR